MGGWEEEGKGGRWVFTALPFFFSSVLQIDRFRAISVSALHPSSPSPPHPAPHRAEGPQGGGEKNHTPGRAGGRTPTHRAAPHRRAAEKTHGSPRRAEKQAGGTIPSLPNRGLGPCEFSAGGDHTIFLPLPDQVL